MNDDKIIVRPDKKIRSLGVVILVCCIGIILLSIPISRKDLSTIVPCVMILILFPIMWPIHIIQKDTIETKIVFLNSTINIQAIAYATLKNEKQLNLFVHGRKQPIIRINNHYENFDKVVELAEQLNWL